MTDKTRKPLPAMTGLTKEYYDWCGRGELRFQRCRQCGSFRHVPREVCAECSSFEWDWVASAGRGTVYTWTVVVRALHPDFGDSTPYAPVVVQMDEGVRIVSQVLDCPPDQLRVGMPVQVGFVAGDQGITLPYFRRV